MASWRPNTPKQYASSFKHWYHYCSERGRSAMSPDLNLVLEFLSHLHDQGYGYSAVNTARSALSTILILGGKPIGAHRMVIRLMKGIFNLRPAMPKTNVSWDPEVVLKYNVPENLVTSKNR